MSREFKERIKRVLDNYPELQEVSDDALEALALAAGLNVVEEIEDRIHEQSEGSRERLEQLLDEVQSE